MSRYPSVTGLPETIALAFSQARIRKVPAAPTTQSMLHSSPGNQGSTTTPSASSPRPRIERIPASLALIRSLACQSQNARSSSSELATRIPRPENPVSARSTTGYPNSDTAETADSMLLTGKRRTKVMPASAKTADCACFERLIPAARLSNRSRADDRTGDQPGLCKVKKSLVISPDFHRLA
jgi:hypothetical protein